MTTPATEPPGLTTTYSTPHDNTSALALLMWVVMQKSIFGSVTFSDLRLFLTSATNHCNQRLLTELQQSKSIELDTVLLEIVKTLPQTNNNNDNNSDIFSYTKSGNSPLESLLQIQEHFGTYSRTQSKSTPDIPNAFALQLHTKPGAASYEELPEPKIKSVDGGEPIVQTTFTPWEFKSQHFAKSHIIPYKLLESATANAICNTLYEILARLLLYYRLKDWIDTKTLSSIGSQILSSDSITTDQSNKSLTTANNFYQRLIQELSYQDLTKLLLKNLNNGLNQFFPKTDNKTFKKQIETLSNRAMVNLFYPYQDLPSQKLPQPSPKSTNFAMFFHVIKFKPEKNPGNVAEQLVKDRDAWRHCYYSRLSDETDKLAILLTPQKSKTPTSRKKTPGETTLPLIDENQQYLPRRDGFDQIALLEMMIDDISLNSTTTSTNSLDQMLSSPTTKKKGRKTQNDTQLVPITPLDPSTPVQTTTIVETPLKTPKGKKSTTLGTWASESILSSPTPNVGPTILSVSEVETIPVTPTSTPVSKTRRSTTTNTTSLKESSQLLSKRTLFADLFDLINNHPQNICSGHNYTNLIIKNRIDLYTKAQTFSNPIPGLFDSNTPYNKSLYPTFRFALRLQQSYIKAVESHKEQGQTRERTVEVLKGISFQKLASNATRYDSLPIIWPYEVHQYGGRRYCVPLIHSWDDKQDIIPTKGGESDIEHQNTTPVKNNAPTQLLSPPPPPPPPSSQKKKGNGKITITTNHYTLDFTSNVYVLSSIFNPNSTQAITMYYSTGTNDLEDANDHPIGWIIDEANSCVPLDTSNSLSTPMKSATPNMASTPNSPPASTRKTRSNVGKKERPQYDPDCPSNREKNDQLIIRETETHKIIYLIPVPLKLEQELQSNTEPQPPIASPSSLSAHIESGELH